MLTKQQIFDKVVSHLLHQGERATSEDGRCSYRGQNGTQCAAGCLIDDEYYSADLEGSVVYSVSVRRALQLSGVCDDYNNNEAPLDVLRSLQSIHDFDEVTDWPSRFRAVARAFNVDPAVVDYRLN